MKGRGQKEVMAPCPSPPKGVGVASFTPFSLATPPGAVGLATPATGPVAGATLGGMDVFCSVFSSCGQI
ncbi:hypothetical protein EYF80_038438 [Liparis tanakae]|uniref:Uncharacterized protein n=1 Tax=Liparis tanakae TaxID=230148 RepID=A0A4Z2GDJ9_9TELE|nr:hypothetical protein EYF80_038438 [Liparis tanakae]